MATKITDSTNISVLDSRIIGSLCDGQFIIDLLPSVFIGSGASNVLGAKVKITNPYGVVIKPYGSGYDIAPPLTDAYTQNIPTQAGKPQYGIYTIAVQLTDEGGKTYEIIKTINVCTYTSDSHPCDERLRVIASCKNGTVTVAVAEPPVFKGQYAESRTIELTVDYPTASGLAQLVTTYGNFSVALFQGVYKFDLEVCATYNMGDNILLRLPYTLLMDKNVKCLLDYTCIYPQIKRLNDKINSNCSQREKEENASVVLDALRLLKTAELANDAGEDASDYIDELETLLGCQCTCDCSGSPIINGSPSTSLAIEGCGVVKTTVGLTDIYTIDNFDWEIVADDTQNVITISAPSQYNCTKSQVVNFSIAAAYAGIKTQIGSQTEYNYWASVVNNALINIDVACLGYTTEQWNAFTLKQKFEVLVAGNCIGGSCETSVSGVSAVQQGSGVLISFTQTGGYNSEVYVDGELKATLLAGVNEILIPDYADGEEHDYAIVPKCSNGSQGTAFAGTFGFLACPSISPPSVSQNTINDADCPYDLTALIDPAPPLGIEVEWHTANNTNPISLVADDTSVSSGVFYAFAKNADGCYSTATQVTLICSGESSCTAPQTLLVVNAVGGFKVSFQSAAFPPPSNSYTVKRKAAADPDVDGSYTTIGTPTWNSSTNRWEITDATGADNTLYTYKAISNCASSTPSVLYNFANIDCPVLSLTPNDTDIDYTFTGVGGEVDKYEVSIYDGSGVSLLNTHTINPAFPNPITGTFDYLTEGTTYKVRVKVFIGTFSTTCAFSTTETGGGLEGFVENGAAETIEGITFNGIAADYVSGDNFPLNTLDEGNFSTDQTGSSISVAVTISGAFATGFVRFTESDGTTHDQAAAGAGVYTFNSMEITTETGWAVDTHL